MDNTALGVSPRTGRRRFISAVGLGGALSALPLGSRIAQATSTVRASAAQNPTDGDTELLAFAQELELSAVELYELAASTLGGEPVATAQLVDVVRAHHQAYADSLSGILGRSALNKGFPALVEELTASFGSAGELVEAAQTLEHQAAATHLSLIGQVADAGRAKLLASIAIGEARHAAAFAALAGGDAMPGDPTFSADDAIALNDYEVEA